jgi:hypothetical protein
VEATSGDITASDNTVLISDTSTISGLIAGVNLVRGSGTNTISDNIVTIRGTPTLGTGLYGVFAQNGSTFNGSGNTLNLHSSGLSVGPNPALPTSSFGEFQNLNFFLPAALAADGSNAMLAVAGPADIGADAVVTVQLDAARTLHTGDTFILIHAPDGLTGSVAAASANCVLGGYACAVAINGNDLLLTLKGPRALPAGAANSIPTLGPPALVALGLLLAALTFVGLRRGKARG